MPTLLNFNGFKFFFYANEHEPMHIHVSKGDEYAKIENVGWADDRKPIITRHGLRYRLAHPTVLMLPKSINNPSWRHGVTILITGKDVHIDDQYLHVELAYGRIISTPLSWYRELQLADEQQRADYRFICGGPASIGFSLIISSV